MKVNIKVKLKDSQLDHTLGMGQMIAIGRSSKCDFQIEDEKISGRHCRFYLKSDRLEVTDLDSKNGTYLNGIRIEQSEVFVGDEVKIGDSVITFVEENFDEEALNMLTFPGPLRDRMSYELKVDFTGARIQNQMANKNLSVVPKVNYEASHAREVDLRRKFKSKIKLSKQEVRSRNKAVAFVASLMDAVVMFAILCLPIIIVNKFVPASLGKDQKLASIVILELAFIGLFFITNFKLAKFTVGEKISGIQRIYLKQ